MFFMDEEFLKEGMDDIFKILKAKTTVPQLVNRYTCFLEGNYPKHVKPYRTRLKYEPEGAKAEAVVFFFLEANSYDVQIAENSIKGGVDFRCKTDDAEFVVEVSCLEAAAVSKQSGLPDRVGGAGHFGMITDLLRTKASSKADQLSGYNCPRVLVIACHHTGASVLLGLRGAEDLLTSETKIAIAAINNPERSSLVTDLDNSVFFRWRAGKVESCRNSISSILLFGITADNAFIVGVLHPEPVYKFPTELLPSVPFVRLKKWPLENGKIQIEWVRYESSEQELPDPKPLRFWYDEDFRRV